MTLDQIGSHQFFIKQRVEDIDKRMQAMEVCSKCMHSRAFIRVSCESLLVRPHATFRLKVYTTPPHLPLLSPPLPPLSSSSPAPAPPELCLPASLPRTCARTGIYQQDYDRCQLMNGHKQAYILKSTLYSPFTL